MIIRDIQPYIDCLAQQYPVITVTGPRQSGDDRIRTVSFRTFSRRSILRDRS
jgi:hypothetical protein